MRAITLVAAAMAAAQATSELSDRHKQWLEEEVPYIIIERERAAFLDLQSSEERDAFIEAFWRRRDPDPLTPVNEFREPLPVSRPVIPGVFETALAEHICGSRIGREPAHP